VEVRYPVAAIATLAFFVRITATRPTANGIQREQERVVACSSIIAQKDCIAVLEAEVDAMIWRTHMAVPWWRPGAQQSKVGKTSAVASEAGTNTTTLSFSKHNHIKQRGPSDQIKRTISSNINDRITCFYY
jgi:hypothetical protein